MGQQADENIERLILRRLGRLVFVRRFIGLWTVLFLSIILASIIQLRGLGDYYQTLKPVAGGVYSEGLIGTFTNANPIYANGAADSTVSRLVFSSLFKYDEIGRAHV